MPNDRYEKTIGEIYCLTFVRGVDETEALLRMGGLADTMRPRSLADVGEEMWSHDAGYPRIAQALSVGSWTVIIEPSGFEGADVQLLNAVSRGTEAVSVLRHDYAEHNFAYSEEGTLVTELAGGSVFRRGSEPDRFLPQMWAVGLDPEGGYGASLVHRHVAALRLVDQITGFLPDIPDGPLPSAHIEPWFSAAEPSAVYRPPQEDLADALDAAPAALRRTVAVREVRRLAELLDVAHFPDVADALTAAENTAERWTCPPTRGPTEGSPAVLSHGDLDAVASLVAAAGALTPLRSAHDDSPFRTATSTQSPSLPLRLPLRHAGVLTMTRRSPSR